MRVLDVETQIHTATIIIAPVTLQHKVAVLADKYNVEKKSLFSIADCESGWQENSVHYNPPTKRRAASYDYGLFQINSVNFEAMRRLSLDPTNQDDLLEYGVYLFSKQGFQPWYSSFLNGCMQRHGFGTSTIAFL